MVLDAAGLSSQSRTRVRTTEDRTREAWQPWLQLRQNAIVGVWHEQFQILKFTRDHLCLPRLVFFGKIRDGYSMEPDPIFLVKG